MTEYQCGNCRESSRLGPSARFCPYCGSTSLLLKIKEEAHGPEQLGAGLIDFRKEPDLDSLKPKEEEKPRRRKQASE